MHRICRRVVRVAGAHRAGRAVAGWFSVVLAVLLTQAVGVLPAVAQHASTSTIASDTILAWGDNSFGQFGNGSTTSSSTPVAVSLPAGTTVTAIAGSDTHSLALTSAGTVLAWGGNSSGQLGNGSTTSSSTPVAVSLPAGTTVTAIAAGAGHSLAVTSTGAALAWGSNSVGQLGNGSTADSSLPVTVNVPTGSALTGVAIHRDHAVATTSAGTALAWSRNNEGQLGDGSTTDRSTPVAVSLPAGTTLAAIAAGDDHSLALVASQAHSTTSLRVSPQDPTADQDVTLTATVTCTTDTPSGTITFRTTTTDLATVPLDSTTTATHTTRLPPGTHTLTAHYTATTTTCPDSQSEATIITITAPDDPDLPVTGPNLPTILGTATLLILTGATLVQLTRRTRATARPR
nr:Ig-like domain repeat protein [Salinispora arenicola]